MVIEVATDNEPHGVDRLIGDLRRWAADARASDAASARSRQRWLRRQAEEESTLAGIALVIYFKFVLRKLKNISYL